MMRFLLFLFDIFKLQRILIDHNVSDNFFFLLHVRWMCGWSKPKNWENRWHLALDESDEKIRTLNVPTPSSVIFVHGSLSNRSKVSVSFILGFCEITHFAHSSSPSVHSAKRITPNILWFPTRSHKIMSWKRPKYFRKVLKSFSMFFFRNCYFRSKMTKMEKKVSRIIVL